MYEVISNWTRSIYYSTRVSIILLESVNFLNKRGLGNPVLFLIEGNQKIFELDLEKIRQLEHKLKDKKHKQEYLIFGNQNFHEARLTN